MMRIAARSLLLLLAVACGTSPLSAIEIRTGASFPRIRLPSLEDKPMSVQAFRGRKTVLHVFASW